MSRIIHFEIPTNDPAASIKFYETVLGWKFEKYPGPMDYWLISTGDRNLPGIDGGLSGAADDFKTTVNTAEVDNLDETFKLIQANGGQVITAKNLIPGVGWIAYIRDPGGTVLGLLEPLPGRPVRPTQE